MKNNLKLIPGPTAALIHRMLLNKYLHMGVLLSICILVPLLVYLIVFSRTVGPLDQYPVPSSTCSHLPEYHVRCGEVMSSKGRIKLCAFPYARSLIPDVPILSRQNLSLAQCVGRGCCYSSVHGCYHFMPSKHQFSVESSNAAVDVNGGKPYLFYLQPMSPTTAHGFTMNRNIQCEIREMSSRSLMMTVADQRQPPGVSVECLN